MRGKRGVERVGIWGRIGVLYMDDGKEMSQMFCKLGRDQLMHFFLLLLFFIFFLAFVMLFIWFYFTKKKKKEREKGRKGRVMCFCLGAFARKGRHMIFIY